MRYLRLKYPIRIVLLCFLIFVECTPKEGSKNSSNNSKGYVYHLSELRTLRSINELLGEPQPGEWLYSRDEPGQSFKEYINSSPIRPTKNQNKIYIRPIGDFDRADSIVFNELKEYLSIFFGLKTVLLEPISDMQIPAESKRIHEGTEQLHTKYILDKILLETFPDDAIVYMAITSKDLYPKESWNFVFGQAYLKKRVGVSSIFRLKPENTDTTNYAFFLNRIMKTASHEITHMFSIKHCTNYKCIMNGSNSLFEADGKPSWLCPDCFAKVVWCTRNKIDDRYDKLILFSQKNGFTEKEEFYKESKAILNEIKND